MTVTSGATGWPVTVGVVEVGVVDSQEQTLSGRGAHDYTAHMGWLGVVTGISAASIGGVLVIYDLHEFIHGQCFDKVSAN